jgi:hypothetical protein
MVPAIGGGLVQISGLGELERHLYKVFYVERFVKVDARIRGFACPKMASGSWVDGYDDLTIATFVGSRSLLK